MSSSDVHGSANDPNYLARRVDELHAALRQADPAILEKHTGATYLPSSPRQGTFYLTLWGKEISLTFPEFISREERTGSLLGIFSQALLAYYFTISDGTQQTGRWISFSELPDGKFYTQAFQGYTGDKLGRVMGNDAPGFDRSAVALGGRRTETDKSLGDLAFKFQVLPYISLLVVCWLGDEDFPASYRILFDEAVSHHLSTDACAIVGSTLARRLINAYEHQAAGKAATVA